SLVALVLLVDSRHAMKDHDLALLAHFVPSGRPVLILATKSDKLTVTAQRESLVAIRKQLDSEFPLGAANVIVQSFSAATRQGVEEAENTIASWVKWWARSRAR